jgi:hypothetical protein
VKVSQAEYPPLLYVIAEHKISVDFQLLHEPLIISGCGTEEGSLSAETFAWDIP